MEYIPIFVLKQVIQICGFTIWAQNVTLWLKLFSVANAVTKQERKFVQFQVTIRLSYYLNWRLQCRACEQNRIIASINISNETIYFKWTVIFYSLNETCWNPSILASASSFNSCEGSLFKQRKIYYIWLEKDSSFFTRHGTSRHTIKERIRILILIEVFVSILIRNVHCLITSTVTYGSWDCELQQLDVGLFWYQFDTVKRRTKVKTNFVFNFILFYLEIFSFKFYIFFI